MATKVKEKEEVEVERDASVDGPLLDLNDNAVKKLIKTAKKRGFVTMDEGSAGGHRTRLSSSLLPPIRQFSARSAIVRRSLARSQVVCFSLLKM